MGIYKLGGRVGRGGMADLFLALQQGPGGFEKLVVVKRIFRSLCVQESFVRMFLDEARLAAAVDHPNVVQMLDIGEDEKGFFIVMEYLLGEAVGYLLHELHKRGVTMEPVLVCRVGMAVAAGLHDAHTATDAVGRPTPVIHRDVTPSNILVCYNGTTKIVDFGVAKAETSLEHTHAGAIKGKVPYLAPEQVLGNPLTAKTDVYQLGVLLYEMVTGRPLFRGKTQHETMRAILRAEVPVPSEVNQACPVLLDGIIMDALHRDPERRTASADVLRQELESALRNIGTSVSDHDLGAWMRTTFADRYARRQRIERQWAERIRNQPRGTVRSIPEIDGRLSTDMQGSVSGFDALTASVPWADTAVRVVSGRGIETWVLVASGVLMLAGVLLAVLGLWSRDPPRKQLAKEPSLEVVAQPQPQSEEPTTQAPAVGQNVVATYVVHVTAVPQEAAIALDGRVLGTGEISAELPEDGRIHSLTVSALGYHSQDLIVSGATHKLVRLSRITSPEPPKKGGGRSRRKASERRTEGRRTERQSKQSPQRSEDWLPKRRLTDNLDPWAE